MTPAERRSLMFSAASRKLDRQTRGIHPHAVAYASAAARQGALPYFTEWDYRREDRRERNTFTQATRTFRTQTDWKQARGQNIAARTRAAVVRFNHEEFGAPGGPLGRPKQG